MDDAFYSVDRANAALPLVRAIVTDVVDLEPRIVAAASAFERVKRLPGKPQFELNAAQRALTELVAARKACTAELKELGVRIGDAVRGVCDFPAMLDGERIYLCWELGEEQVEFYHGVDAGYGDRMPLPVPATVS